MEIIYLLFITGSTNIQLIVLTVWDMIEKGRASVARVQQYSFAGPDLPLSGLKAEPHKWPEHNRHWSGPTNLNCSDKLESDILYSAGYLRICHNYR